ncbi:MAG: putative ABC transporter permease [Lachnospiraceae bacterium]|nr:putative ABC transporter permease [Lachnospiraceae bacterium]
MEQEQYYLWAMMIIICSFIGFVIENVWLSVRYGFIDNRNMHLPFLLGYGVAIFLIYHILGEPARESDIAYFAKVFFMVSLGEIVMGTVVEKTCGVYYWDYSTLPLHFTRYTSLFTSIGFALIITAFMRTVFPVITAFLTAHEAVFTEDFCAAALYAVCVDHLASFVEIHKNGALRQSWRIDLRVRNEEEQGAMARS